MALGADKVTTVPVHFARGADSAQLHGTFSGYDSINYEIAAQSGQQMTVKIEGSRNANFNVFAPGDQPGQSAASGSGYPGKAWSGVLPRTGTYTVQVYQMRASARRGEKVPHDVTFTIR
ncbi:MAG: g-type lysozyme inhibitor [Paraburkholderia sp.]|nr:g-type lysozyme inhibitor [Paraburkholderia sp.]